VESQRPDPDELLKKVQDEEARQKRARLKIFFGMAPGVGKTFAMLQDAQDRRAEGVDVVAGVVETHGRADTQALTEGLEVLPKRQLPYRGVQLEEFDLEAAIRRHPALVLVDELAHTNVQGSTHTKRWQDILDLLDAGIDVYTTVNVQHLESVKDTVAQITGVIVRESIPDTILNRADQMELVDIPPELLMERLREGKVYVPEQAQHAIERFFRKGNLLALRELALRRTATHVDADMRRYMEAEGIKGKIWAAGERLLVCVNSKPPATGLIRAAARMAEYLGAPWIALYVETGKHIRYSEEERVRLEENLRLAERLGAETAVIQGDISTGEDILDFAASRNVTRIIVGQPVHPHWRQLLMGSLVGDMLRRSHAIDILVIPNGKLDEPEGPQTRSTKRPHQGPVLVHYLWSAVIVGLFSLLCLALGRRTELADYVMIYVLGILVVATRFGRWPSLMAAGLSVVSLDFFFVEPRYSFNVGNARHFGTFLVMLIVAFVIGNLTERLRSQMRLARTRERRLRALFRLSGELTRTFGLEPMTAAAIRILSENFRGTVTILLPGLGGRLVPHQDAKSAPLAADEMGVAQWVFDHHEAAGLGTDTLPGARALYLPLKGSHGLIGVMGIQPQGSIADMEPDQRHLLEAYANQTALALERTLLARENLDTQRRMDREQVRSALLDSVGNDLQTPLADISQAAQSLMEEPDQDPARRQSLLGVIRSQGHQLVRLVTNLVDASRLESTLELNLHHIEVKDLLGGALDRIRPFLGDRQIRVDLPGRLPAILVDPALMEQVVLNLLENAHRFSPPDQPIEVKAWGTHRSLTLTVSDHGPGIPEGEEERIFEQLVRFPVGDAKPGAGLGLSICKGILAAHRGKIQANNRPQGGATFLISLPLEGEDAPALEE
jgi:two-component system, OmpR family, sensor histidine kinase KdpD